MPSIVYQEIVQKIPLLTPEEKERLLGFLRFDEGKSDASTDLAPIVAEQNGTGESPIRVVPVRCFDAEQTWLRQHRAQYRGQFVALAGDQLLAHGVEEGEVIDQARHAGVASPFVTYIETEAEEHYLSGWLTSVL